MQTKRNNLLKWILSLLLFTIASLSFAWVLYQSDPQLLFSSEGEELKDKIDEKAKKIFKDMSTSLSSLKEFSFKSKGYFEMVDSNGKKEKLNNSGELFVKRPDKIKAQRAGEKSDVEFYCDGKTVTVYGNGVNYYASAPAGENLDKTFDYVSEKLDIELPATDLLYSNVYDGLMQAAVSGQYLGKEKIGNVNCDHLSFQGNEVDWQIWIDEAGQKLPKKYLIISKKFEGKPEYSIEFLEWNTNVKLDDKMFTFVPPKGSKKIEFAKPQTETEPQSKK